MNAKFIQVEASAEPAPITIPVVTKEKLDELIDFNGGTIYHAVKSL